jgi:DNA repair photolyase
MIKENEIENIEHLISSEIATKLKRLKTEGTKEWADSNVNIASGCSNNCRYCYAKKMAIRFKRKTEESWKEMEINQKAINKGYRKRKGRIMFPSSHDITVDILVECVKVLRKILSAGNQVLITTKPDVFSTLALYAVLEDYKDQVQFRFTITSINDKLLEFWEPNASSFAIRLFTLIQAFENEFKTSVSIEPFLDEDPGPLINELYPYITESIWIGPMNYIWDKDFKTPEELMELERVKRIHQRWNLIRIYNKYKNLDKIRFKDSFMNRLGNKK